MAQIPVPTVGIILGNGYSGGAIPLATTNILLCVRDGVFNTIQPRGLAGIARKYDLSWQECAKYVGVSSYELCHAGLLDGVIDFVPGEEFKLPNLIAAIGSAIQVIEWSAERYVALTPEVFEHYRRSVFRYLDPSQPLRKLQHSPLSLLNNPTEQPNIFGVTLRHLRYLGLRRRIQSTTPGTVRTLSAADVPRGELKRRTAAENRRIFQNWMQAPLEIRYDDQLAGAWKQYIRRRRELNAERSTIGKIFLGDQDANFHEAVANLLLMVGFHLMNQWKGAAQGNFLALADYLGKTATSETAESNNFTCWM
jgi:Acetyl-CoA carboxylase alpha subunit